MVILLRLVWNILLHEILCIFCDLIQIQCKWQMIETGGVSGDGGMAAALSVFPRIIPWASLSWYFSLESSVKWNRIYQFLRITGREIVNTVTPVWQCVNLVQFIKSDNSSLHKQQLEFKSMKNNASGVCTFLFGFVIVM